APGVREQLQLFTVWLPFFFADVVAGLLICRVARRSPIVTPGVLPFIYALYLLSWPVFFGSPVHSHFESVVLMFLLLGLMSSERQRYLLGGVLCGLAMLTKQTTIVVMIPQLFILWRAMGWRAALRFG